MIQFSDQFRQALEKLLLIDRRYNPGRNIIGFGFGQKMVKGLPTGQEALRIYVKHKYSPWNLPRHYEERPVNRWIPLRDNISYEDVYNIELREQTRMARPDEIWTDIIQSPFDLEFFSYRNRYPNLMGGISVGIENETTGTLGYIVRNDVGTSTRPSREFYILTAGHILDNFGRASSNKVCQPGALDLSFFGLLANQCEVADIVEVKGPTFSAGGTQCRVDAGIARPLKGPEILELKMMLCGAITGIGTAEEGMIVKKVGRTTGLTFGKITDVKASHIITSPYDPNKIAVLSNQIITTEMSRKGDSGSILLDEWNRAIGLLCAGDDSKTVFTPMHEVCSELSITLF